jgi:hypothetical protein
LPEQQENPALAYNATQREFLLVWWNDRPGNDDVYAQRTDQHGQPTGPWFAVTWGDGLEQRHPDVAWNSRRNEYLVVWVRNDVIYGRRVGPTGQLLGGEFMVSSAAQFDSSDPAVAYAYTTDSYLVVWDYRYVASGFIQHSSIVARLLSGDGQPQGGQFYVSQDTQGHTRFSPELAYNQSRNEYLVVWMQMDMFTGAYDARGRRATGSGNLLLPESIGIATGPETQLWPAVGAIATDPAEGGRYLVTWVEVGTQNQVLAQRLHGDARLQGTPLLLDLIDPGDYGPAAVYGNEESGSYLTAWRSTYIEPYFRWEIHVQEIAMDGSLAGTVEVLGDGASTEPDVAAGDGSTFLVVYQEQVSGNRDIWGQLWGPSSPGPTPTGTPTNPPAPPANQWVHLPAIVRN